MARKRRRTDIPRIEQGQLTPFDIAYDLHYATQVHKIAHSMIGNQPYQRLVSDEQKIPSPYYCGRFKNEKEPKTWIIPEREDKKQHTIEATEIHLPPAMERAKIGGVSRIEEDCIPQLHS